MIFNSLVHHYRGKTVIVNGASGYIGSELIQKLLPLGCQIIAISRHVSSQNANNSQIVRIQGDYTDPVMYERLLNEHEVDTVFHLAAQTSIYLAEENIYEDYISNILPLIRLAEVCQKSAKYVNLVFAGTATQYGLTDTLPVDETHPSQNLSGYDLHKNVAESYLEYFNAKGVFKTASLRFTNVYGLSEGQESKSDRGVVNLMVRRAAEGLPLTVYRSGAECVRDYLHVSDAVQALLLAPLFISKLAGTHCLIGTGEGYRIIDVLLMIEAEILRVMGKKVSMLMVEPEKELSAIEYRNFVGDCKCYKSLTSWRPKYALGDGIAEMVSLIKKTIS